MTCIRKRRGKYVVDYRDHLGVRRGPSFRTREEAEDLLSKVLSEPKRQRKVLSVRRDITVAEYSEHWLRIAGPALKPSSRDSYAAILRRAIVPCLGRVMVRKLHRGAIKAMLADRLREGRARDTVRLILATLRVMLNAARFDDELIRENPADGLARVLRLARRVDDQERGERVKAFTREELLVFLGAAWKMDRPLYPLLLTLARAGLRIGEALALRPADVDLGRAEIRVARAFSAGVIGTTKSGRARSVDMSPQLVGTLRMRLLAIGADAAYLFPSETGTALDAHNVAKRFRRVLKAARLPLAFHPHCLRHSYASLLLAAGVSPAYVQEQLGHASIELTVGTYGRWIRKTAPGAVAALDDCCQKQVVAKPPLSGGRRKRGASATRR